MQQQLIKNNGEKTAPTPNRRNMIAQKVKMEDGSIKTIWHQKKFANGTFHAHWQNLNKTKVIDRPYNSKLTGAVTPEQKIMAAQ